MKTLLLNEIYRDFFSSIVVTILLGIVYLITNLIVSRKIESHQRKQRFRIRFFYLICLVYLIFMARIWIEGFTHIFAVLGLVSAALVVTNKETIMNLVGWFVIIWRGLFSEEDLIQIQQLHGYVKTIGLLYFSLLEVQESNPQLITGRLIKVPNGLVMSNPLINYSAISHLSVSEFICTYKEKTDPIQALNFTLNVISSVLKNFYKDKKEYSSNFLKKKNPKFANQINLEPSGQFRPKLDKPFAVEVIIHFYCFARDKETLGQLVWIELLKSLKKQNELELI